MESQGMQERRKVEMQQAAEAEAASKARASLLRENIRKANHKVLLEAERVKAEGRATWEAASQALLAAVRCQAPMRHHQPEATADDPTSSCCVLQAETASVGLIDVSNGQRESLLLDLSRARQVGGRVQHLLTADDMLLRPGRITSSSSEPKVKRSTARLVT